MKQTKILIALLIGVTLIFNFTLLNKIGELNNRIRNLESYNQQLQSSIHSIPGRIDNFMNEVKQMESWITPITLKPEVMEKEIKLNASWQIKDYNQNSEVVFHYQPAGEEFKEVVVNDIGEGYFEASFSVDTDFAPQWFVSKYESQQVSEREVNVQDEHGEAYTENKHNNSINYYVSTKNGDNIKSSEIEAYNLQGLANGIYGMLRVDIHVDIDGKNKNFTIGLDNFEANHMKYEIENVVLKTYKDDSLISTNSNFEYSSRGERDNYILKMKDIPEDFTHLVLEVKYDNGKVFKNKIYTK